MAFGTIDEILESINATLFADPNKDDRVAEAECMVSECTFGKKYNLAVALYAAHLLALDNQGDGSSTNPNPIGIVKREKEDRVEIEHPVGTDEWFKQTSYGSRFLMVRKTRIFTARTRWMGCN